MPPSPEGRRAPRPARMHLTAAGVPLVAVALLAGCTAGPEPGATPMPTESPAATAPDPEQRQAEAAERAKLLAEGLRALPGVATVQTEPGSAGDDGTVPVMVQVDLHPDLGDGDLAAAADAIAAAVASHDVAVTPLRVALTTPAGLSHRATWDDLADADVAAELALWARAVAEVREDDDVWVRLWRKPAEPLLLEARRDVGGGDARPSGLIYLEMVELARSAGVDPAAMELWVQTASLEIGSVAAGPLTAETIVATETSAQVTTVRPVLLKADPTGTLVRYQGPGDHTQAVLPDLATLRGVLDPFRVQGLLTDDLTVSVWYIEDGQIGEQRLWPTEEVVLL